MTEPPDFYSLGKSMDKINYKVFMDADLVTLLQKTTRWLKESSNIHIWDFTIGGANREDEDWEATIYYFSDSDSAEEAKQRNG